MRPSIASPGIQGYVEPWNLAHNSIVGDRTKAPHGHPLLRGAEQCCPHPMVCTMSPAFPKRRRSSWLCGKGPRRDQTHKSQSRWLFLGLAFTSFTPASSRICGFVCCFFNPLRHISSDVPTSFPFWTHRLQRRRQWSRHNVRQGERQWCIPQWHISRLNWNKLNYPMQEDTKTARLVAQYARFLNWFDEMDGWSRGPAWVDLCKHIFKSWFFRET